MPPNKNKKFKKDPAATIGTFSKNLLGLKFMQRAKKEVEKVAADNDESFESSLSSKMKNKQLVIINPSYQFCERLRFGRLSFKGMNLDIEAIMMRNKQESEKPVESSKRVAPPSESSSEIDNLDTDPELEDEEEEEDSRIEA